MTTDTRIKTLAFPQLIKYEIQNDFLRSLHSDFEVDVADIEKTPGYNDDNFRIRDYVVGGLLPMRRHNRVGLRSSQDV